MKIILALVAAAVVCCAANGLISGGSSRRDPSAIKRAKAEQAMVQTYGANWFEIYRDCVKTNRALSRAMAATYASAIGYHRVK